MLPVNCDETCKVLPRPPERSGIIMLKLKRKLKFRGHVYFQAVRPQLIENALNWLKQKNPLYCNVTTNMNNIDIDLQNVKQTDIPDNPFTTSAEPCSGSAECCSSSTVSTTENDLEENDDPLNEH